MKPNPYQQFQQVPSREAAHSEQIACLLAVSHALQPYLLEHHRELDPLHKAPELDGGAQAAASATFIGVCKRLDEIISDSSRWNLEKHHELYSELVKTQQAQQAFLGTQQKAAEVVLRPSFQMKPSIAQVGNGFVAIFGDPNNPALQIVGLGVTPEAALQDFDAAFARTPSKQIKLVAENFFEQQEKPQPKKGRKKNNE